MLGRFSLIAEAAGADDVIRYDEVDGTRQVLQVTRR